MAKLFLFMNEQCNGYFCRQNQFLWLKCCLAWLVMAGWHPARAATKTWIGGSGDWNTASNWSGASAPGSNDSVVIGAGAGITVTHSFGANTVASVASQQAFVLSGGTLTVAHTFLSSNTFTLAGGTLQTATVVTANGAALVVSNGALDGVTVDGVLDVGHTFYAGNVRVTNGLILNGTALMGNNTNLVAVVSSTGSANATYYTNYYASYGGIEFDGSQKLGGNGTVVFESYYNDYYYYDYTPNALWLANFDTTLTIGSGITVRGQSGQIGYSSWFGGGGNLTVINEGSISCDESNSIIDIIAEPVVNNGSVAMSNGGSLYINYMTNVTGLSAGGPGTLTLDGAWQNNQTLTVPAGGTLALDGNWTNAGTINETNATVNVGGTFALAQLGAFNCYGGTLNVVGTLVNTGTNLMVDAVTNPWALNGGTILGGTVVATNGLALIVNGSGTLNGVTVDGALDVGNSFDGANLYVTNGLTLDGTALVGNPTNYYYGGINFEGSQTLGGNGTVVFGDEYYYYYYYEYDYGNHLSLENGNTTLTIGRGITVRGQNGAIGYSYNYYYYGQQTNVMVINLGNISCDVTNGTIYVIASPFVNNGSVAMSNGGSLYINYMTNVTGLSAGGAGALTLNGTWQNNQTLTVPEGGTLSLNGNWTNAGTINETNATVNVGGTFALAQLGAFNCHGGTLNVVGTLVNTGTNLGVDAVTNPWALNGGTILGGTVVATNGLALIVNGSGTLNGVTVDGALDVGNSFDGADAYVTNGLTLDGTALVGNPTNYYYGGMDFTGSQMLSGSGTVVLGDYSANSLWLGYDNTTLTIGSGMTVRGQSGQIGYSPYWYGGGTNLTVVNQGLISCDVNGGIFYLTAQPLVNEGSVAMSNGGSLYINYMTNVTGLSSSGAGTLTLNGTWQNNQTLTVGSGETLTLNGNWINAGTISETNATVNFDGTFTFSEIGRVNASGGRLNLNGTLVNSNTTMVLGETDAAWVLNGGTILGGTIVATNGASLVVSSGTLNGVTIDGVLDVGNSFDGADAYVTNGLTLDGTALVGNPTNNYYGGLDFEGSQTLGGNGTVVFGDEYYYYYYDYYGYGNHLWLDYTNTTLTIGRGITVRGQNGGIGYSYYYAQTNATVLNEGTIRADVADGTIFIDAGPFDNQGLAEALHGGRLNYSGTYNLANGTNLVSIGGLDDYGQIAFAGNVLLTTMPLTVTLDGGYVPALGSGFPLVTYGSATGFFGNINLPQQDFSWQANYGATTFELIATNEVAPLVAITSPTKNAVFQAPVNMAITASATNNYAATSAVEFFASGRPLGQSVQTPYGVVWSNAPPGIYMLTAKSADANGNVAASPAVLITVLPAVPGSNYVWVGSVSSDWFTAGNWSPAGVPGVFDSATITGYPTVTLSTNAGIGFLNFSGGDISGSGLLTVSNSFDWIGGYVYCPVMIQSNAVMNISGSGTLGLVGALTNAGTVNWVGPVNLEIYNYPAYGYYGGINNLAGAVFNAQNDQTIYCACYGDEYFINAGLFEKRPGTATTSVGVSFTNTGTLDVAGGTVAMDGQFTGSNGVLSLALNGINANGSVSFPNAYGLDLSAAGTLQAYLGDGFSPSPGDGFTLLTYPYASGSFSNLDLPQQEQWEIIPNSAAFVIVAVTPQQTTNSYTWTGGANSDWFNPTNWSPAGVPDGRAGEVITVANGLIDLSSPVTINGEFNWLGGALTGSALTIGSNGALNIDGGGPKYLQNTLSNAGTVIWADGDIVASNCSANAASIVNLPGASWEIWCDQSISASCPSTNASWENFGAVVKLANRGTTSVGLPFQNTGGSLEVLQGTLAWNAPVVFDGASVTGAGAMAFNDGLQNNQAFSINDTEVGLNGAWTNAGTIDATNSVVSLGGTFAFGSLGTFNTSGGSVNVTGTFDNTGATLVLGSLTPWILEGGTIVGGTVMTTNDGALMASQDGGLLNGVTITGSLDVGNSIYGASLAVTNGLVLDGTALVGGFNSSYGGIDFCGSQTLSGQGTVVLGSSSANSLWLAYDNTTLTIGSGITVRGQYGQIGYSAYWYGGGLNLAVVNQGLISCDVGNGTIYINAGSVTNQGTIQAEVSDGTIHIMAAPLVNDGSLTMRNGGSLYINYMSNVTGLSASGSGTLTLDGTWQNNQVLSVAAGTTLTLNGFWTNAGTIIESNAIVNLGGTFTLGDVGALQRAGGAVNVTGTVLNTNTTLVLNATTGSWALNGGTILGGTVAASNGWALLVNGSGTLNGVTVDGVLDVGNSFEGAELTVTNGLDLNGTALVGNPTNSDYGGINFEGSQALGGNGTVVFGNYYYDYYYGNHLWLSYQNTTLTIGSGITVRGQNGAVGYPPYYEENQTVVNQGLISCDVTNGTIYITAQPFVNNATVAMSHGGSLVINYMTNVTGLSASGGGSLTLDGAWQNNHTLTVADGTTLVLDGTWTNAGTIIESNATLDLGGTFTAAALGAINRHGGTVNLTGTLDNTGTTLILNTAIVGSWVLKGGTIIGGTVVSSLGPPLLVNGSGALDGVTVDGVLDVGNSFDGADLTVTGGLTLNGTALVGNPTNEWYGRIDFDGSQTLNGNGAVVFGDYAYAYYSYYYGNALSQDSYDTTLTLGSGITVRGQNGSVGGYSYYGDIINLGTISADVNGGTILVEALSITNAGNLEVANGATLDWDGDLNFNGPQFLSIQPGGTVVVGGNVLGSPAGSAQFNVQGTLSFGTGSHQLEAMSQDLGNVAGGFIDNLAYGGIMVPNGAQVTLVDLSTNTHGGLPQCVYVNSLSVAADGLLNVNGLHLYARLASDAGTITNGAVIPAPDNGGALVPANTISSAIPQAGAYADWTFYGLAGQHVAIAVATGGASILAPQLSYALVQLLDPATNLVAQAFNTVAGQVALINGAVLPADGTYSVQVRAPVGQPNSTGNYQITVWTLTTTVAPLVINQQINGKIATPYSVDQWSFSGSAGQSLAFDLLNTSSPGVAFNLSGPNGWVGFSNLTASSGLITLPSSGGYLLTAYGTGGQYGINFAFELVQSAGTNVIALGTTYTNQLQGSSQAQLVEINITNSYPMKISLSLDSPGSLVELYAKFGSPPTPSDYDYAYQGVASQTEDIIIPSPPPGSWYILIYGVYVPQVTLYSLEVIQTSVILEGFSPSVTGTVVNTVLSLNGVGFNSNTVVQLVPTNGGGNVLAQGVTVISPTEISAFFASNTIPAGTYTVCASSGGAGQCLTNLFTVILGGLPDFQASFTIPSVVGYHQPSTIYVYYANTGSAAMPAPLLLFTGTQSGKPGPILTLESSEQSAIGGIEETLLSNYEGAITNAPPGFTTIAEILAGGSVPGLLQPGESNQVPIYYAGWLEPWDFNRPPLVFSLTTYTSDSTNILDWASYGSNSLPAGVSAAEWTNLLSDLEASFGQTLGSYVSELDGLASLQPPLSRGAYDASQVFNAGFQQITGFGAGRFSGQVMDMTTSQPVTNTQVVAKQQFSSGQSVARGTQTDGSGNFFFTNLPPGTYQFSVFNYDSAGSNVYTLTDQTALSGIILDVSPIFVPVSPPPLVVHTNEASPALAVDSTGAAHLVWTRGGEIWHAYYSSNQWVATGGVSGAEGLNPVLLASSNLLDGSVAGLMIAWEYPATNGSALYFSVATNLATSSNSWSTSTPQLLSDGETTPSDLANQALALVVGSHGQIISVWQKKQTAIVDDTDLYYKMLSLSSNQLTWPGNNIEAVIIPVVVSKDAEGCITWTDLNVPIFSVPVSLPLVGGNYSFTVKSGKLCGDIGCTESVSGSLSGSISTPEFDADGSVTAQAKWVTDQAACAYVFDSASISPSIEYKQKVTLAGKKLDLQILGADVHVGLGCEYGIGLGGTLSWQAATPSFLPNVGFLAVTETVQGYGKFIIANPPLIVIKGDINATATLTGTFDPSKPCFWAVVVKVTIGGDAQRGPVKWDLNFPVWKWNSCPANGDSVRPLDATSEVVATVEPIVGTTNVYGGTPVLTNVASNVVQDGDPSLAVTPAGNTFLAWTLDSDNTTNWLGNRVVVATLQSTGWSPPAEVTNSRGFNSDVSITTDSLGNPLLVWAMASNEGISLTNSADEVIAAMSSNNVVFSTYDGANWRSPANVAILTGTQDNITLAQTAHGGTLAAWFNQAVNSNDVPALSIYAAFWDGTAWSAPLLVTTGKVSGRIAASVVGGATTLFWTVDSTDTNNPSDTNVTYDSSLYSSSFDTNRGQWSAPQVFTAGDLFAASQSGTNLVADVASKGFFNPFTPPTNCCSKSNLPPPPPPPPPCADCPGRTNTPVGSQDPNAKIGPAGYGPQNWVLANEPFPYTIDFENSTNATAPAQIVNVYDPLSTNFDWTTFELAEIGFGSNDITIPHGSQFFETNVTMTYDGVEIIVQIQAGITLSNGEVYANFNSVDAATLLAPPVNIGFLPPEDGTGRGEGHITYFVQPKAGLPQGTQITNVAFVTFDQNPVIATDQANDEDASQGIDTNKMDLITIDDVPPVSAVNPLPYFSSNTFSVCWSGTNTGPAIVGYDIYVSTNNGPWSLWLSGATNTCASFQGQLGSHYGFYSIAFDGAGNTETAPTNAQAGTSVQAVIPAEIEVFNGAGAIANGQTNPVNFGSVRQNAADSNLVFTVTNVGGETLTLASITVPANYLLNTNFPSSINVGTNGTFSVQLSSSTVGAFAGNIIISNNDPSNGTFVFPVTGLVTSIPTESLVVMASPTNGGTVNGSGTYVVGSANTVTATAANGYVFINWTTTNGAVLSTNANYTFILGANVALVANFAATPPHLEIFDGASAITNGQTNAVNFGSAELGAAGPTVTFTVTNLGGQTLDLTEITVPSNSYTLDTNYPSTIAGLGSGTFSVQLRTANVGTHSGVIIITNNDPGNNPFTFAITGVVTNLPQEALALLASPTNGGAVSGSGTFSLGSANTVTATAANGYVFINWTTTNGAVVSTTSNYTFTLSGNETLVANFLPAYTLTVNALPANAGTVSGGGTFAAGSTKEAAAAPDAGFVFIGWTGEATGTNNPLAVTMNTNVSITANFATNATNITLTVTNSGPGGVSPNLNGKFLKAGQSHTLTATAKAGNVFSNWTGSITTNKNPLTIKVESSMALQANFITNPFPPYVGTYNGLFINTNGVVTEHTAGMLKGLTITKTGTYSGTLLLNGASYGLSGAFGLGGQVTNPIAHSSVGPLKVVMTLVGNEPPPEVKGMVSATNWGAWLTAERATNTTGSAEYTMLIPADTNYAASASFPGGDGYALITNHAGTVKITGALADGTTFSQSVPASLTGDVPLYANLYSSKGLLLGWINLEPTHASGPVAWVHPKLTTGLIKEVFASTNDIMLSRWTNPPAGNALPAVMTVFDSTQTNYFTLTASNEVKLGEVKLGGVSNAVPLSGSINLKTGLLTVTIGSGAGKTTGYGAILLNATNGGGYLLSKTNAQAIQLGP
jgi:uncharacterized repeat protein (TIGR02543 family)